MSSASTEGENTVVQELLKTAAQCHLEARESKVHLVFFLEDAVFAFKSDKSEKELQLVANGDIYPQSGASKKRKRSGNETEGSSSQNNSLVHEIEEEGNSQQTLLEYFLTEKWKELCQRKGFSSKRQSFDRQYSVEPEWAEVQHKRDLMRHKDAMRRVKGRRFGEEEGTE